MTNIVMKYMNVKFYRKIVIGVFILFFVYPPSKQIIDSHPSVRIFSQEGNLLRSLRSEKTGTYSERIPLNDFPDFLIEAILLAEDKRFYWHPGFDPLAIMRAIKEAILNQRIISGASTLTQQLVRIAYRNELPKQNLLRKCIEIILAIRLELHYSKKEILEAYLNQIYMGRNRQGLAAASMHMFAHNIQLLTKPEAIALVVLIRRSNVSKKKFLLRFNNLSKRLYAKKLINQQLTPPHYVVDAIKKPLHYQDIHKLKRTMHFSEWFSQKHANFSGNFYSTLSDNLNKEAHQIIQSELSMLSDHHAGNAAIVVLKRGENKGKASVWNLASLVGSKDFFDDNAGQVNGALSIRSAGSTLKPFIYAMSFERLGKQPYSIIEDKPTFLPTSVRGEIYKPRNSDLKFWGNITIREALVNSRNIPAISMLNLLGVDTFYDFLDSVGLKHIKGNSGVHYGLGLTLGIGGINLLQLAQLYSILINQGELMPIKIGSDDHGKTWLWGETKTIFKPETAFKITHILSDRKVQRRVYGMRTFLDFPFQVAIKTGTSKDFKDAWTVGYTTNWVVAVWVGNFSGSPMEKVSGSWGAGRIFHLVMRELHKNNAHTFEYPNNWKRIRLNGRKAGKHCSVSEEIIAPDEEINLGSCVDSKYNTDISSSHLANDHQENQQPSIVSPISGEEFLYDPGLPITAQHVPIEINYLNDKSQAYFLKINGNKKVELSQNFKSSFQPRMGENKIELYRKDILLETIYFQFH